MSRIVNVFKVGKKVLRKHMFKHEAERLKAGLDNSTGVK